MADDVAGKAKLVVWIFDRLGICALVLVAMIVMLGRQSDAQRLLERNQARLVESNAHFDAVLLPQVRLLRAICRGMARAQNWPHDVARECDIEVPPAMGPELAPDRAPSVLPDFLVQRTVIGG
jgi:hypothetical protein